MPERFEKYHKFKEHLLRKTGFKKLVMEPSDNYRYWTGSSAKKAFEAQQALLEGLQYVSEFVGIGKDYINTICLNQDEPVAKKTLVMAHGYGAALGFFYKNYPDLKELKEYKTYSIDWLGMGVSSRPMFVKHHKAHSDLEVVENAENFFVDSLEEWRIKKNIEKFVLMGHSLGGYLGTAYALKYPERVEKLILVSPGTFCVNYSGNTRSTKGRSK